MSRYRSYFRSHFAAAVILAAFVLALFFRLLFTDRVLASGDILHYFYPYRGYAADALRGARLPLWNPYIFSGVPFLANPQAAVLYPLHWPLSWMPVTKQIYWSGAIHAWILGMGGYALMRRWGYGWLAGVVTTLTLAGSGFYGGLLGHINQMNAAAWLPWMVWGVAGGRWQAAGGRSFRRTSRNTQYAFHIPRYVLYVTYGASCNPHFTFRVALFALLVALTLLAGHTQMAYINLFGVGVWLVVQGLGIGDRGLGIGDRGSGIGDRGSGIETGRESQSLVPDHEVGAQHHPRSLQRTSANLLAPLLIYISGIALALLLSAAQILPTLELSELGIRGGGLSYWDVTSFSLQPLRLHWTLLPSYGLRDLSVVFGTLGYTEFVAYVGIVPLLLAIWSVWAGRWQPAWVFGLLLAGMGLFLALGRWNPAYYVLYKLVPGFDLFRTPARWMMLYTLGMAVLAGVGAEAVASGRWQVAGGKWSWRMASGIVSCSTQYAVRSTQYAILITLIALDLLLAARALPHTHPTAPQAVYDVRTAPAHLLTDPARTRHPAAMGRFLSISAITFDPGDMADWRRIYREGDDPQLDEMAFAELIVALKSQEILAPNLPLFWRIPAVDGFDGGVLPLQRYNQFLTLLIPPDELVPDGRVREQLDAIPAADLLGVMNARYVITDKVRDLWFEGVYYDRQIGATLAERADPILVENPHPFEATAIGVIGFVDADADQLAQNQIVAEVQVLRGEDVVSTVPLLAGSEAGAHFADPQLDSPTAAAAGATVAFRDVARDHQEYLAWLALADPLTPDALRFRKRGNADVVIQAVTLVDERTETFVPLLPSDQGRFRLVHSGDVKIYEALDVQDRAYLASRVVAVESTDEALTALQQAADRSGLAVVETDAQTAATLPSGGEADGEAEIVSYAPERIVVRTQSNEAALLVLSDAVYPGWRASVDGRPAPIYPTNVLFRGVPVPAGEHEVIFTFRSDAWRRGVLISMAGIGAWIVLVAASAGMWLFRRTGRLLYNRDH